MSRFLRESELVCRFTLLLLAFGTVPGCYPFRDGHRYYCPGAINLPTGTTTRHWQAAQVEKSGRDGLVLYEASWIDGSDQLGPAAIERLAKACKSEGEFMTLVTLEPTQDQVLNDRRKRAILDLANQHGFVLSPDSVVLAYPDGNELHGEESVRIAREMMQGNQQRRQGGFGAGTGGIFGGPLSGNTGGFPGIFSGGP